MVSLARRAARRRGFADYRPLLARARAAIGVALARRLAQMALSCQARLSFGSRAFLSEFKQALSGLPFWCVDLGSAPPLPCVRVIVKKNKIK